MSSKSTIALTTDNEHIYHDCNDPVYVDKKWIGDKIFIEFDKKHISILSNDEDDLIISLDNPNSEIYKLIQGLKKKVLRADAKRAINLAKEELRDKSTLNLLNDMIGEATHINYSLEKRIKAGIKAQRLLIEQLATLLNQMIT